MAMRTAGKICIAHLSCAALLWLSTHGLAEEPGDPELGIRQVVPSGEDVPAGNQIVIEFDQPVVPLGRMERRADELPITIKPELKCKWRWLNPRALACNLDEQDRMREAMRYSVTIDPGIETTAGTTTATRTSIEIVTVRPMISNVSFRTWRHPGVPVLRVVFNQPVTKSSTQRSLRLLAHGHAQSFPVTARADPDDRELPHFIGIPGERAILELGEPRSQASDDQFTRTANGEEARRVWLIEPETPLPLDSEIVLDLNEGLVSALGPEPGIAREKVIAFHSFPEFRFLGVRCRNNRGNKILISAEEGDIQDPDRMCNPLERAALSFSTPVLRSQVAKEVIIHPDLAGGRDDYDPWASQRDYSGRAHRRHFRGATYDVWLPESLRAFQQYELNSREPSLNLVETLKSWFAEPPASNLRDEFGRRLSEALSLRFWTNHRNPDFTLVHRDAVLESGVDSEVPLYVTNLDQVRLFYRLLGEDRAVAHQVHSFSASGPEDVSFAIPLGVREMAKGSTGAVFGTISSDPALHGRSFWQRRFFGQVTPYQVHAKLGHFNTLVWVTDLETGAPVPQAQVSIYRDALSRMRGLPANANSQLTDENGTALLPGTLDLDPSLDTFGWRCREDDCERLFVRVDGAKGMALLPLNNRFRVYASRVSNYRVYLNQQEKYGHLNAWGTTAQGVYRAGDTVEYKIYVRDQDNEQFVPAPAAGYTLELVDPTGKAIHSIDKIVLNEFGAFHGDWKVPETSVMGWYDFRLKSDFAQREWRPMRVLISDFTPAMFRVQNQLNGDLFRPGDKIVVDTQALLHSGGAYTQAEARVTARLQARRFSSSDPVAGKFRFDTSSTTDRLIIHQEFGDLSDQGTHEAVFDLNEERIVFARMSVESAVRDDRGKYIASTSSADYVAVDRFVGLRKDRWVFEEDEPAEIESIVVNGRGEPVADTAVDIRIERLVTKAARVKGAGNAYLTNFVQSWEGVGECSGSPNAAPLACAFTPESPGSYRMIASVKDSEGRSHSTNLSLWVAGKGEVVWREEANNALQMIAESKEYKVGDQARFLIKNPFPGATALVTLERYGVIKQWQTKLEGGTPVLEFPIEESYLPGAYLSVVVFSPRVEAPPRENAKGAGQIDLGKPAFRIGYAKLSVVDPNKQIQVTASTDRQVYRPGELVKVTLNARPKRANAKHEPIEYAVVVLDEAVFDLIAKGKNYFDPYQGFYALDALDVANYSLLTRLVGRQDFEKKGANAGGGGGEGLTMRTIFKFVGYWNPSLAADADGNASFEFSLPDNLTGWRVLALAATPSDGFGLGDLAFQTNRPTEIRPVMPNQVTESDRFEAGFSVMNRTEAQRTLEIRIQASGDVAEGSAHVTREIILEPYQRETLRLPLSAARLKVGRDTPQGAIRFRVSAGDEGDSDALAHELPVLKARNLEVAASYGSLTDASAREPLAFPENIFSDLGEVSVVLSPTVIGNVEGAFRYLRDYGYQCWEQILSKGVMASHFQELQDYLDATLEWPESPELPQKTLDAAANFQAPNGGMAYFVPRDQNASPYLSAYTALAFNWLRDAGYEIPANTEQRLHEYLLRLLRRDEMPSFYSRAMASSVRAVALKALAARGKVNLNDLRRYLEHIPHMDLFGTANFLHAASEFDDTEEFIRPLIDHIMARSNATSGKLAFSEVLDDGYARILSTQLRSNCALLSAFSSISGTEASEFDLLAPAMARAITQSRGNREHWENTQENVFCMNALIDYARRWEDDKPDLKVEATFDDTLMGTGTFTDYLDQALEFATPILPSHPGKKSELIINREGQGRVYYAARLAYSPKSDNSERINAGIDLRREYSVFRTGQWQLLLNDDVIKQGELIKVDLFVNLPSARNFVVVDDHVPGGLEPVNRDLATSSGMDAQAGGFVASGGSWWFNFTDWISYGASRWSFYHREMRHDAVRFYSDYLPAGRYHLAYTAQAIAAGSFRVRPAQAMEMYDADVYGKTLPRSIEVRASD